MTTSTISDLDGQMNQSFAEGLSHPEPLCWRAHSRFEHAPLHKLNGKPILPGLLHRTAQPPSGVFLGHSKPHALYEGLY